MADVEIKSTIPDKIKVYKVNGKEVVLSRMFNTCTLMNIVVDGILYDTMERYLQSEKARLFGDNDTLLEIMNPLVTSVSIIIMFGRQVKGFSEHVWMNNVTRIILKFFVAMMINPETEVLFKEHLEFIATKSAAVFLGGFPWGAGDMPEYIGDHLEHGKKENGEIQFKNCIGRTLYTLAKTWVRQPEDLKGDMESQKNYLNMYRKAIQEEIKKQQAEREKIELEMKIKKQKEEEERKAKAEREALRKRKEEEREMEMKRQRAEARKIENLVKTIEKARLDQLNAENELIGIGMPTAPVETQVFLDNETAPPYNDSDYFKRF